MRLAELEGEGLAIRLEADEVARGGDDTDAALHGVAQEHRARLTDEPTKGQDSQKSSKGQTARRAANATDSQHGWRPSEERARLL